MLVELTIRDFALVDQLTLGFGSGLNAITGETGAGKSTLVAALEVLAGARPRGGPREWVREGAARATVEGRFVLTSGPLARRVSAWLAEHLPAIPEEWDDDEEGELVLSRTITAEGKTRAHVNHRPATKRALAELASLLFEIHGQNDHQLLLEPAEQLRLVDAMGALDVDGYRRARGEWRRLLERFRELQASQRERKHLLADLRFQANELEDAELGEGEREKLDAERQVLRSAEELGHELGSLLDDLSEGENTALDRVRSAERSLSRWGERVVSLEGAAGDLRETLAHLEEACASLVSFADSVEANPSRLEAIESRLAELDRLVNKYGTDDAGLQELAGELRVRIAELEGHEESLDGLESDVASKREEVASAAALLTRGREKVRKRLGSAVEGALAELGMEGAAFEVVLAARDGDDELERFGPRGADRIEFLLGANRGEPVKPLRHVASGGEAARIMLALRSVLAVGPAPAGRGERTLVFDEIDAGVGGHLAPKVASHLHVIAEGDQVLCVTHLPAIAAAADHHLKVQKEIVAGRSRTAVEELGGERRVLEVADMIAGGAGHETARAEARRLIGK